MDTIVIFELQKLTYQSEAELYDDFCIPPLTQTLDELRNTNNTLQPPSSKRYAFTVRDQSQTYLGFVN